MDAYLVAQTFAAVVLAVALTSAALVVRRRRLQERQPRPARWFAAWWLLLGAAWATWAVDTWLVDAARGSGGALAAIDLALSSIYFLLILMAFASLFGYLLYLYTGREGIAWISLAVYGVLALALIGMLVLSHPAGTSVVTGIDAARFGPYQAAADAVRVALLLPAVLAALALVLVPRRIEDPVVRHRVLLVSASLFLYLLMPLLLPSNPGVRPADAAGWAREAANKLALVLSLLALFRAYRPVPRIAEVLARAESQARGIELRARQLI